MNYKKKLEISIKERIWEFFKGGGSRIVIQMAGGPNLIFNKSEMVDVIYKLIKR